MLSIEDIEEPGRYTRSDFKDSKFVKIESNEIFDVKMQYPAMGMLNAEPDCLVREEVYQKLVEAHSYLPIGYKIRIWDAWRPFALQRELYVKYSETIVQTFGLCKETDEFKEAVIRRFVSDPVEDREVPPVHTTGGAVDVTLLDSTGALLVMGTTFDEFSDKTRTAYFENEKDEVIKKNRRLLYSVMTRAGFTNLPSEWWHYDYGDRFWAYYNNVPTMFRGLFTREELNSLLQERRG